jgi:hypothetical protein
MSAVDGIALPAPRSMITTVNASLRPSEESNPNARKQMKSRLGFVSNSSTSSYLIICTKEDHEKALEKLHPYYKA